MAATPTSWIQKFFTSRDNNADGTTFVGEEGRLWYDPITNTIRVSDGIIPGGIIVTGGGGGLFPTNIDGGSAHSTYLVSESISGGAADTVYTPAQVIFGGSALIP